MYTYKENDLVLNTGIVYEWVSKLMGGNIFYSLKLHNMRLGNAIVKKQF